MVDKQKLATAVEKELHGFVNMIKEHTRDFVVLYVRRNNVEVDSDSMAKLLDVVDKAIMDGFQKHIDRHMKNLDKSLSKLTGESDTDGDKKAPLSHTNK